MTHPRVAPHLIARAAAAAILGACGGGPGYLRTYGEVGNREARLGWILLIIAAGVVVVVTGLLGAAILRRRRDQSLQVMREGGGLRWIVVGGVVVPTVILAGVLVLSTSTLAAVSRTPASPLVVEVTGHRWWWEIRYLGAEPEQIFTTSNEIHLPAGRPVRLDLSTADVIHSFWIPQLAGKMDLIPGQHNVTWVEADSAGAYWGHCAEYCGMEHANMAMSVVADPPARFARWLEAQRRPAAMPTGADAIRGQQVFLGSACAVCHAIRGTDAGGAVGPDLTHLASRRTIAAGILPNDRGHLAGWIANPQALKPGTQMPRVPLRPDELRQLLAYLQQLH